MREREGQLPENWSVIFKSARVMQVEKSLVWQPNAIPDTKLDSFTKERTLLGEGQTLIRIRGEDGGNFLTWWLCQIMPLFEGIHTEDLMGSVDNLLSNNSGKTQEFFVLFLQAFCTFKITSK